MEPKAGAAAWPDRFTRRHIPRGPRDRSARVSRYCLFCTRALGFPVTERKHQHTPSHWHPPSGPPKSVTRSTARVKRLRYMTVAVNASPLKLTTDPEREPLPSGLEPRSGCHGHTGVGKPLYVGFDESAAAGPDGRTILAMCDLLFEGKSSEGAGARVVADRVTRTSQTLHSETQ